MDIEILSPLTLKCYPGLEGQLRKWAELSLVPTDGLLVRISCGNLLEAWCNELIWTLDPRDLTKGMPKIIGYYKSASIIELDVITDKPRWGLLAYYFFHELGHYKDYLQQVEITEEAADAFAKQMLKRVGSILPRRTE